MITSREMSFKPGCLLLTRFATELPSSSRTLTLELLKMRFSLLGHSLGYPEEAVL